MADYSLGTARGVIEIDYVGTGAARARADLKATAATADATSAQMKKVGGGFLKAGSVVAAGFGVAIYSAAKFEKKMSAIQAVSGASGKQIGALREKALQLGKDTQFSAGESAAAIEELIKAGLSTSDVLNGAADATVSLAAAGSVDMPTAATIASNAMNQFQLTAKQLPHVVDLIAGAANASAIDVKDFGASMAYVGPVAHTLGVNMADTATAIAILGNQGIKGTSAGTNLRSIMARLTPTTRKASEEFHKLGLITKTGTNLFFDQTGKLKPLNQVIGILHDKTKNLTKQQKITFTKKAFGVDNMAAVSILAGQTGTSFDKMAGNIGKVKAADVAKQRMNNLAGSFEQLKGSVETFLIIAGTPLLKIIRGITDVATKLVNAFISMPSDMRGAVGIFLGVIGAGLLIVGMVYKIIRAVAALKLIMATAAGPWIIVILAVALLAAGLFLLYKRSATFRGIVNKVVAAVKQGLGAAFKWLVPIVKEVVDWLGKKVPEAFHALQPTIQRISGFLRMLGHIFMDEILPAVKQVGGEILGALIDAFHSIMPQLMPLIKALMDFGRTLMSIVIPIGKILIGVIGLIMWAIMKLIPPVLRIGGFFAKVFIHLIGNAIKYALRIITNVFGIISGVLKVFKGLFTGNWRLLWQGVKQIFGNIWGIIKNLAHYAFDQLMVLVRAIGPKIVAAIKKIPGMLRGLGHMFVAAGKSLISALISGFGKAAGFISSIAGNIWNAVKGLINGAIDKLNSALQFTIGIPGPDIHFNLRDIPHLARGAHVTSPQVALIGEAGPETVLPDKVLRSLLLSIHMSSQPRLGRPGSAGTALNSGSGGSTRGDGLHLVRGHLSIDPSGRAYIEGVAQAAVDDHHRFAGVHGRMGGR